MYLSDLSIRRPVLATVMSLTIILVGVISFLRLSVREYPNIDAPVVSVRTVYSGASSQVIESQITQPLEDSLAGIEGIKKIKSVSREEVSQITIEFVRERDADSAANDIRDRVARVRAQLPDDAADSVVSKVEADAQAIIWLAFYSDHHSALEITDYADRYVADSLKTLTGVSSVIIGGDRRYAMRIWLDRDRLAARGLTPKDVEDALRSQNVEIPSGRIESKQREFTVLAETDLRTEEDFEKLVVREINGYPIKLSDVGRAELGALDYRNAVRVGGSEAVGLGIVKQSTANTLSVAEAVKLQLPRIRASLPPGMNIVVAFDSSLFIEHSISAVYSTMLEALILVVLVIFLFLRSWRATLIPFVTIPVSLVGSFAFLYALDFSINVLTLLGIVLAIGLVVDDAIVMLENIHRHMEQGMSRMQAALSGSKEITFAVVAMTLTLTAVFAPLAFMTGNTGRLFTEFALTVASAVLVSGFVALTLTPMMCSKLLKHEIKHGYWFNLIQGFFDRLTAGYGTALTKVIMYRRTMLAIFFTIVVGSGVLYIFIPKELAPLEDRGIFIGIELAPEGATMEYTDAYARQIEAMYAKVPEIKRYFVVVAPGLEKPNPVNFGMSFVMLKPWGERARSQQEIVQSLQGQLFGMPGVLAFLINPPALGQSFRNPQVQFVVQANTYPELQTMVDKLMGKLRAYKGITNPDSDLKLNKPQLAVDVDRAKAADLGVDVDSIGRTLETMLGGRQVTRFKREGKQYDVIVKLEDKARTHPSDLTSIYVRNRDGALVQLSNLVQVRETVAPKELNHFNRLRAAVISGGIAPGYTSGQVLDFMDSAAKEVLTESAKTDLDGQSKEFRESGTTLYLTFVLALAFIYLVLAAQFESFISPFVIMLTVPLAIAGALLALFVTYKTFNASSTLNVYSEIGLVMLVGLITKHGILIVEFANQLSRKGRDKIDAVVEAATLRLRPILMTTAAMVLGAVPLAFAMGAGAESRRPIGWVIVGGLLFGTFLTLFVIPTLYVMLMRKATLLTDEQLIVLQTEDSK